MKKIFFILMLIPGIGLSQSIGLKAGAIINPSKGNYVNGVYGVTLHFGKKLQFGIEPGIYTLGVNVTEKDDNGKKLRDKELKLSYFEIPLTLGYTAGEKFLYGGSIGVSPKYLISNNIGIVSANEFNADFIVSGFAGFKLSEKTRLLLNIRYGHSLSEYQYISPFINFQYKL